MNTPEEIARWRGEMDARMRHVETSQERVERKLDHLIRKMDEVTGGKKALWTLLAGAGMIISIISAAATYLTLR